MNRDVASTRPGRPAYMPPPERFDPEVDKTILLTKAEWLIDWGRKFSLWPLGFGLACCAIEMISTAQTKYDISRFGAEVFRATPRQADVMIVAGTVTHKMAPRVKRLWDQMADPKWVIAMGACTVGGGPYFKFGYHIVKGVDKIVPVDIYLPGCPPRPEALLESIMRLQELVVARSARLNGKQPHYTPPEPGSRQAVKDGLSPAEPWKCDEAMRHDEPKRLAEEEAARKKSEAAKKKAEDAAKKKAEEEAAKKAEEQEAEAKAAAEQAEREAEEAAAKAKAEAEAAAKAEAEAEAKRKAEAEATAAEAEAAAAAEPEPEGEPEGESEEEKPE